MVKDFHGSGESGIGDYIDDAPIDTLFLQIAYCVEKSTIVAGGVAPRTKAAQIVNDFVAGTEAINAQRSQGCENSRRKRVRLLCME